MKVSKLDALDEFTIFHRTRKGIIVDMTINHDKDFDYPVDNIVCFRETISYFKLQNGKADIIYRYYYRSDLTKKTKDTIGLKEKLEDLSIGDYIRKIELPKYLKKYNVDKAIEVRFEGVESE